MLKAIRQYKDYLTEYSGVLKQLHIRSNWIAGLRLLSVLTIATMIYLYFKIHLSWTLIIAALALVAFFFLINIHARISRKKDIHQALVDLNATEIDYLQEGKLPFENGIEFSDLNHFYDYDLDVFGENGLFQNLNRTTTFVGKKQLAMSLLGHLPAAKIKEHQLAINELSEKVEWRQQFTAVGKLTEDKKSAYEKLILWAKSATNKIQNLINVSTFLLPLITIVLFVVFIVTRDVQFRTYLVYFILANLFLLGRHVKKINLELESVGLQFQTLKNYAVLFRRIENEEFKSSLLQNLKQKLSYSNLTASSYVSDLARRLNDLESMKNVFGAILMNGLVLYHMHSYRRLLKWKEDHADEIEQWLDVIGKFEALNSLANLAYNNENFVYPTINGDSIIKFEALGHPLIDSKVRVDNSIDFSQKHFVILTGSNMSGKSTFLRTLGVNMILTGAGAPICAQEANVHPMPILVSMRLSDSLSDNESYFFAEVKRLKAIMDEIENKQCFVLLDEILRGTNSDDKRAGTKEVIRKLISKKAIGMIATHDLEVCSVTKEYPEVLANKRFEVEIVNNELNFDYKIKEGICQNKNASFLMKKMGVI